MKNLTIEIKDSLGNILSIGDKVMLQEKRNGNLTFYTTIQVVNGQLYPINKFCFDRIVKVDSIPEDARYAPAKAEENMPEYWMHPNIELYLIEENKLNKWRLDVLLFEHNNFITVKEY